MGMTVLKVYDEEAEVGQVTPCVQVSLLGSGKGTHTTTCPLHLATRVLVTSAEIKYHSSV